MEAEDREITLGQGGTLIITDPRGRPLLFIEWTEADRLLVSDVNHTPVIDVHIGTLNYLRSRMKENLPKPPAEEQSLPGQRRPVGKEPRPLILKGVDIEKYRPKEFDV